MFAFYAFLYALSGFAFLSAEVILIREMGLRTGSTPLSAAWILSVFFVFAAIGAKIGGRLAVGRAVSARRYGWVELGIGVSLLALYLSGKTVFAWTFLGQWWEFGYALYLAAIPSLLSGMTLPLLGQALSIDDGTRRAGLLYGVNLFGAALGIAVGGVYLPWKVGYLLTVLLLVGLLGCVALGAIFASSRLQLPQAAARKNRKEPDREANLPPAWVGLVMVLSGALTLATEILAVGYFQIIAEESIYSYSAVFLVFLLGLAIGALVAVKMRPPLTLVLTIAAALMLLAPLCLQAVFFHREMLAETSEMTYYLRVILVAAAVLLPLLAAQGAVFPLAWAYWQARNTRGASLGHFLLLNKLGAAVGVLMAGYYLVRYLGYPGAFILLGAIYGVLSISGLVLAKTNLARWMPHGAALALALFAALTFSQEPVDLSTGENLVATYRGKTDLVTVIDDAQGSRHIRINQAYTLNGTQRALSTQLLEGWLPCFLSPNPKRILFIGMASGISADAVLNFPVEHLKAVELSPEVVQAAKENFSEWNTVLFNDPRAEIVKDDGRHVLAQSEEWDVIIADLFNPIRAGTSQLYSQDFFSLAGERLAEGGLMVSWVPAYQFDESMLAATLRAFADSFEFAILIRANFDPQQPVIGLVGSNQPINMDPVYLEKRLAALPPTVRGADPPWLRSGTHAALIFLGDLKSPTIQDYLQTFPPNTDNRPYLAFRGPRKFAQGELLRGTNILNWGGQRFLTETTPSVNFGAATTESVVKGQRAANHLFAAATMRIPIPNAPPEKSAERRRRMLHHLQSAHQLWPVPWPMEDLGR